MRFSFFKKETWIQYIYLCVCIQYVYLHICIYKLCMYQVKMKIYDGNDCIDNVKYKN